MRPNPLPKQQVARYAAAGVLTPDHAIRTKAWPLIVPAPQADKLDDFKTAAHKAAQQFIDSYKAYFARHTTRAAGAIKIRFSRSGPSLVNSCAVSALISSSVKNADFRLARVEELR